MNSDAGLYIHIPFCKKKCGYCDFYSVTFDDEMLENYIEALITDITQKKDLYNTINFNTIYIGGGTPSVIPVKLFEKLITVLKNNFNISDDSEFAVEANPESLTEEFLDKAIKLGVNRICLGIQSLNDNELEAAGRIHNSVKAKNVIELLKKSKIKNFSCDLIIGLPNQTKKSLKSSLDYLISKDTPHISLYSLKIEENTPFYKSKNQLSLPTDDNEEEMYYMVCETLKNNGYLHYEVSNFSKLGFESRHNLKYWLFNNYLGLGPAAHSFIDNKRFYCEKNLTDYINAINKNDLYKTDFIYASVLDIRKDKLMLALRTNNGIDIDFFNELEIEDSLYLLKRLIKGRFAENRTDKIILSDKGFRVMNSIIIEIFKIMEKYGSKTNIL